MARKIAGSISADGKFVEEHFEKFEAGYEGDGKYRVDFKPYFRHKPVVVVTSAVGHPQLTELSERGFQVANITYEGSARESIIYFTAVSDE